MTEWLWTGESAFCKCTHHVTEHCTRCNGDETEEIMRRTPNNKPHRHGRYNTNFLEEGCYFFCECRGFEPYKIKPGTNVETEPLEIIKAR